MVGQLGDVGYLRIGNEDERVNVSGILVKNGYTVSIVRQKKNGKAFDYFVKYELKEKDLKDGD